MTNDSLKKKSKLRFVEKKVESNFFPDSGLSASDRGYRVSRFKLIVPDFTSVQLFLNHPVKIKKMSLSNRCIDVRNFERETLGRFWTRVRNHGEGFQKRKKWWRYGGTDGSAATCDIKEPWFDSQHV